MAGIDHPGRRQFLTDDRDSSGRRSRFRQRTRASERRRARARARILHETLHGTLQVMHRDFFREDDGTRIPSRSLADVFSELEKSYEIKLQWLAVDTKAMHIDHEPQTDFEKAAVAAFKADESEYEQVDGDAYRYAGRIRLSAVCLTCHLSRRSNNNDRSAALTITMPWAKHRAGE
ncbi:MAG: DUF3365 domain-containing protein [Planctomycetaceae bacterium]